MGLTWNKRNYFVDDRGWSIFDLFCLSDIPGQVNYSQLDPNVIKAFHLHRKQDDYVVCLEGKVKLIVAEEDWSGVSEVILDEFSPKTCHIPKNTWHGYKAFDKGAKILYYCTREYDGDFPDEERAPWYAIGKEIWDIQFK